MTKEEQPTNDQIQEMEELIASVKKDDYISKRKKLDLREGHLDFWLHSL